MSAWSTWIRVRYRCPSIAARTSAAGSPASSPAFSIAARSRTGTARSLSCTAQKPSLPRWTLASSASIAAGMAFGCMGSGLCLKAKRTLPP
jgi:hypothetical protein